MTPSVERRVRRLLLAAPEQTLVSRGRLLIEDALRTATLPGGTPGRVLCVRRLQLGAILSTQSPSSVALVLERRLAETRLRAVHADTPDAASSAVVYFHDALEPYALLAMRLARRAALSGWYWPLAVPGWRPNLSARAAWQVVLRAIAAPPGAPAQMARIVARLSDEGTLDEFLGVLEPSDGLTLLAIYDWRLPLSEGVAESDSKMPRVALRPALRRSVERWLPDWSLADPRSAWLAASVLAVERPALLADAALPRRALTMLAPTLGLDARQERHPAGKSASSNLRAATASSADASRLRSTDATDPIESQPLERTAASAPGERESDSTGPESEPDAEAPSDAANDDWHDDHWSDEPMPTAHGGFYFLLPLLNRLGFPELLEARRELLDADFPMRLLRHAAHRLHIPADDPVLLPLRRVVDDEESLQPLVGEWFRAVRVGARRLARIGLVDLTRRPGLVEVTRTHVDLSFDLYRVDMRIRRAGLDIDPGWTPWLGKVVLFHFVEGLPVTS